MVLVTASGLHTEHREKTHIMCSNMHRVSVCVCVETRRDIFPSPWALVVAVAVAVTVVVVRINHFSLWPKDASRVSATRKTHKNQTAMLFELI